MSASSRPGETPPLLGLWLLYALLAAGLQVHDGVAQAVFLKRVGFELLPVMFVVKAGLDLLAALLYVRIVRRLGHRATMVDLLLVAAATAAGGWLLMRAAIGIALGYAALFALNEVLQTALKMHWGVFVLDHIALGGHDAGDSRHVAAAESLPTIYTGARIGAVGGGLLLGLGATGTLAIGDLLVGSVALFIAAALLTPRRPSTALAVAGTSETISPAFGPLSEVGQGVAHGQRSPLLRALATATAVMVVCRFALRFRYSEIIAGHLGETELARCYGLYAVGANLVAALLQLLLTRWLLVHTGLTGANLLYAVLVPATAAALWLQPGLPAAVLARVVEHELKVAIKTPVSNLFYGALAPHERPPARALVFGLVVPLATVAAALAIGIPTAVEPWLLPLSLAFVVASVWQNRTYSVLRSSTGAGPDSR